MEIWGIPVIERDDMPKGSIILADPESGAAVITINIGSIATREEKERMKDNLEKQFSRKITNAQVEYSQKVGNLAREHERLLSVIDALPES